MKKELVLFLVLIISIIGVMSFVSAECTDSDNGINYYLKGTAVNNQTINDVCMADNPKQLSEAYCENDVAKSVKYDCPNGCSEGACLCPTTKCNDGTIYGPEKCKINYNVCVCPSCPVIPITCSAMPTCLGAKDTGQKDSDGCPIYSCQATPACTDSDGGVYEFLKGKISDNNGKVYEDFCIVAGGTFKYVNEFYCDSGIVNSKVIECVNSCSDGACIVGGNTSQCSSDSDCPTAYGKQYCNGNASCYSATTYTCSNGKCIVTGGGTCQLCSNGCYNGVCIQGDVKEQVKCIFDGSTQLQKCYTAGDNLRAYCSGTESCVAGILGYKGEQITWKSTCGGYAYTIMDGNDEYAKFSCSGTIGICQSSKCDDGTITECKIDNGQCICSTCPPIIIKPVCGNGICESGEGEICLTTAISALCEEGKECKAPPATCGVICPQDCKITEPIYPNINEKFKLQVYQAAKIVENGNHVMKISFRDLILSECGEIKVSSEAAETIESKVAIATGMVIAPTETATTTTPSTSSGGGGGTTTIIQCNATTMPIAVLTIDIIVNSEIGISTMLNLNVGEKRKVGEFTVVFLGYDYASRTGTFIVTRETFSCPENCKCDENGKTIECAEKCEKGKTLCPDGVCRDKCSIISEDCKYGCMYDGKCFPIGVRSSGLYCSVDLNMNSQLNADDKCENNFECSSNVCVSGKCVSSGLINRILNWFKRIFGGECGQCQYELDNQCFNYNCCSDSDCSDNNRDTVDRCKNPSTINSTCTHEPIGFCGDGKINSNETSENCCVDVGCPQNKICKQNKCVVEYVVATKENDEFYNLANYFAKKKNAEIIVFTNIENLISQLRSFSPTYLAIVLSPDKLTPDFMNEVDEKLREIDKDPFLDVAYGYISAFNVEEGYNYVDNLLSVKEERGNITTLYSINGGHIIRDLDLMNEFKVEWDCTEYLGPGVFNVCPKEISLNVSTLKNKITKKPVVFITLHGSPASIFLDPPEVINGALSGLIGKAKSNEEECHEICNGICIHDCRPKLIDMPIELDADLVLSTSCLTARISEAPSKVETEFEDIDIEGVPNNSILLSFLKSGTRNYIGPNSVANTGYTPNQQIIDDSLLKGKPIGIALKEFKNYAIFNNIEQSFVYDGHPPSSNYSIGWLKYQLRLWVLFGDPEYRLTDNNIVKKDCISKIKETNNGFEIELKFLGENIGNFDLISEYEKDTGGKLQTDACAIAIPLTDEIKDFEIEAQNLNPRYNEDILRKYIQNAGEELIIIIPTTLAKPGMREPLIIKLRIANQ